jgi:four helix bundle protein
MRKIEVWREMAIIKSFRELDVYVLARKQAKAIFTLSKSFPQDEKYSLTDQIRRSSRAVNAMIAEAWARRRYPAAFINKIDEALGEAMETQAWLDHALDCGYLDRNQYRTLDDSWQKIGAMLNRMIQRADDFCRSAGR